MLAVVVSKTVMPFVVVLVLSSHCTQTHIYAIFAFVVLVDCVVDAFLPPFVTVSVKLHRQSPRSQAAFAVVKHHQSVVSEVDEDFVVFHDFDAVTSRSKSMRTLITHSMKF